jgi:oligopeptidase B
MRKILTAIVLLVHLTGFGQDDLQPPDCKKIPKTDTVHGKVLTDNYYWLKDRDNPGVLEYIKAENSYTEEMMKPTRKFQKKLYKEILSRIKQTDMSVPYKLRGYWYYDKTEKGKDYPIYCRKKDSLTNKEEVLLDVNEIIKKHNYYDIDDYEISINNELMAYYVDKIGNFEYEIHFKDLKSGTPISDTLRSVTSLVWANDNKTLFYSIQDSTTNRSYKVFKHTLGQPDGQDELIYHEKDSIYDVYLNKSKSEQYIFLNSSSKEQSEVRYLNANTPDKAFKIIHPREKGHLYYVFHYEDKFYIASDKDAINYRLMEVRTDSPSIENWKEVIPHREDVMLVYIDIFNDYLVLTENHRGIYKIRIKNWITGEDNYIPFEEETYDAGTYINPDFNTKALRYMYSSLRIPYSIYEYNMETREQRLLKRKEVLGGYDPSQYESERLWAVAGDSTKVPISIVYKKGLQKNGENPVYIEGYGAYGSNSYPDFLSWRLNLLDRGFIYAIAHVRGGSDLGKQWYYDGKLLKKKNTFTDFIACAEHLIKEGYTSEGLIVAEGSSAGGLLAGAVVNMKPELFKAVILNVPFVDVINTMLDPNMPLTTEEYEEWGNPNEKEYFDYILSYSPYDNIVKQDYPSMLFLTGMTDEQVSYWEPAKMTAKLRDMKTDNNKLLLKVELSSGHWGVSGRYGYYKEIAFEHAFILTQFDIWK